MEVTQLHHVTVMCSDADRSMAFYQDFLNLTNDPVSVGTSPDFAHLTVGVKQQIHLRVGVVPEFLGQHYCLEVTDLKQATKEAEDAGVPVRLPRNDRGEFVHILDPDGNDIELRQRK